MYTYKNVKTGVVITTHGKVNGKEWQEIKKNSNNRNQTKDNETESDQKD